MSQRDARADTSGSWTYTETVARGHYETNNGGLFGKHDNVRTYWEDEVTLGPTECGVDMILLDPDIEVGVLRGGVETFERIAQYLNR